MGGSGGGGGGGKEGGLRGCGGFDGYPSGTRGGNSGGGGDGASKTTTEITTGETAMIVTPNASEAVAVVRASRMAWWLAAMSELVVTTWATTLREPAVTVRVMGEVSMLRMAARRSLNAL